MDDLKLYSVNPDCVSVMRLHFKLATVACFRAVSLDRWMRVAIASQPRTMWAFVLTIWN